VSIQKDDAANQTASAQRVQRACELRREVRRR